MPVVVRDMPDGAEQQMLELALVENLQREDLNPVDEALAYQRLVDEFGLTQDQIAAAVGKDRTSVANYLRLLQLPEEVRGDLAAGALSMGHARALLALSDAAAQRAGGARGHPALAFGARDRSAGQEARRAAPLHASRQRRRRATCTRAQPKTACASLLERRCALSGADRAGTIEIDFGSESELNRLYAQLLETARPQPS